MSSILKALKKLEEEKTLHEESTGINVSREILRPQPRNGKIVMWFRITACIALAVIATLTALLLKKPALKSTVPTTPVVTPVAVTGTTPPPVSAGTAAAPAPLSAPERRAGQQNSPAGEPPKQPAPNRNSSPELPASHTLLPETPPGAPATTPQQGRAPETAEKPITLTGIAWNKDSVDRLAIINGQPAAIGASVGGVVIEEIMPDRVRVNSAGRSFEIVLGSPAKTN